MSDNPPRNEYVTECPHCQQRVTATLQAHNEFSPDNEFTFKRYLIAECRLCYQALLLEENQDSGWGRDIECVWPTPPRALAETIPEVLRREHFEARTCFKSKAYTATVVMVRRTLEGVCTQHRINKKPLHRAFEEMKSVGLIEGRLLEWAQELRVLGNEGAHFTGKPVTRQDASDAIALAEALLDYLYVFNEQFLKFKERRKKAAEMAEKAAQNTASEKGTFEKTSAPPK
ncbi:DUF4145 domain-containing protein [Streptomyces sp. NPDC056341]|uniref:DUF4145 domain-containing protein n=1 Tax=Streptomyces sp. NPDC056341 TaxID=3345788 RepID=UPI0035DC9D76